MFDFLATYWLKLVTWPHPASESQGSEEPTICQKAERQRYLVNSAKTSRKHEGRMALELSFEKLI